MKMESNSFTIKQALMKTALKSNMSLATKLSLGKAETLRCQVSHIKLWPCALNRTGEKATNFRLQLGLIPPHTDGKVSGLGDDWVKILILPLLAVYLAITEFY